MNQASKVKPISVRMALADPFRSLECVKDVRQIIVGIRLVDEVVQPFQGLHYRHLETVETAPFFELYFKNFKNCVLAYLLLVSLLLCFWRNQEFDECASMCTFFSLDHEFRRFHCNRGKPRLVCWRKPVRVGSHAMDPGSRCAVF